ncbi:MAG: hypothetical protein EHM23_26550 [Acidobacteria bacterium]|nr:MAG: hypothetical protein EHM23_26550 [Acidobacteriota bacterium]
MPGKNDNTGLTITLLAMLLGGAFCDVDDLRISIPGAFVCYAVRWADVEPEVTYRSGVEP